MCYRRYCDNTSPSSRTRSLKNCLWKVSNPNNRFYFAGAWLSVTVNSSFGQQWEQPVTGLPGTVQRLMALDSTIKSKVMNELTYAPRTGARPATVRDQLRQKTWRERGRDWSDYKNQKNQPEQSTRFSATPDGGQAPRTRISRRSMRKSWKYWPELLSIAWSWKLGYS